VGERIAPAAVRAPAAAMPRTVLGELERELPALAATMDAAVAAGRAVLRQVISTVCQATSTAGERTGRP
jgi:hypothetical protein